MNVLTNLVFYVNGKDLMSCDALTEKGRKLALSWLKHTYLNNDVVLMIAHMSKPTIISVMNVAEIS